MMVGCGCWGDDDDDDDGDDDEYDGDGYDYYEDDSEDNVVKVDGTKKGTYHRKGKMEV